MLEITIMLTWLAKIRKTMFRGNFTYLFETQNIYARLTKTILNQNCVCGRSLAWLGHQVPNLTTRVQIPVTAPYIFAMFPIFGKRQKSSCLSYFGGVESFYLLSSWFQSHPTQPCNTRSAKTAVHKCLLTLITATSAAYHFTSRFC